MRHPTDMTAPLRSYFQMESEVKKRELKLAEKNNVESELDRAREVIQSSKVLSRSPWPIMKGTALRNLTLLSPPPQVQWYLLKFVRWCGPQRSLGMQNVKSLEERVERLQRVLADRDKRINFLEKALAKLKGGEALITTKVWPTNHREGQLLWSTAVNPS